MNPQTIRNQSQLYKVREAYLANLELEQNNLKKTADAVSIFNQTGQVPLAPQDTRSVNEKLADIEKLKINLRKQLMTITDGQQAADIMNALSNEEIQSLSIVFGDIATVLKAKYANGVPAPIFLEYIRRYLKDFSLNLGLASGNQGVIVDELKLTRDMMMRTIPNKSIMDELIRSIEMAPDSAAKDAARAATRLLGQSLPNIDDIIATQSILSEVELANLSSLITDALQQVPSAAQVQKLSKDIINTLRSDDKKLTENILTKTLNTVKIQQDELAQLNSISEALRQEQAESSRPKAALRTIPVGEIENVARLLGSREKIVKVPTGQKQITKRGKEIQETQPETRLVTKKTITAKDRKLAEEVISLDILSEDEILEFGQKYSKPALVGFWSYITKRDTGKDLTESEKQELGKLTKEELLESIISGKSSGGLSFEIEPKPKAKGKKAEQAAAKQETAADIGGVSAGAQMQPLLKFNAEQAAIYDLAQGKLMEVNKFLTLSKDDQLQYMARLELSGAFDGDLELKRFFEAFRQRVGMGELVNNEKMYTQIKTFTGMGMKAKKRSKAQNIVFGCGLAKTASRPKKQFVEKIDFAEGLPKDKSYIPFGKYVINKHKLTGGILQVRTIKGGAVSKLPTLGISPALGGIIKKMVGGGLPTYDEMNALNEDEKNTLYKVFKLSQIDKADMLPSPDKTKEEEDLNRFQILKGQLLAGNDSIELVKEFKRMLMRFISGGKIPRREGMDLMCDLISLGY